MPAVGERRTIGSVLNKLIERVNSDIRRLRILEQESSVYKTRLTAAEEELLAQRNQLAKSVNDVSEKITQLDERLSGMENTIKEIISQLKKATTTTKIKELEQLIEIYSPLKSQFLTRDEVERIIDDRLNK